ncbi:uncharacterized protein KY384_007637 [Bacidia gigantensis]|uniref:uncharacterized protein n=1 Tax=Bacidia gigantensis TaxID=2732470 RepID=UPI001D03C299|nr:uncharacterized protein KY384_007637 [Bacidia gigantensis]KAG8527485.1 hypothetical protein KY384_007637 [Bacidia gigantensis]
MLKLSKGTTENTKKVTVNLLPCSIQHDGTVNAADRYWKPEIAKGKIKAANRYQGIIVKNGGVHEPLNRQWNSENGEEEDDGVGDIRSLHEVESFEHVQLWEHEAQVEGDDAFAKGLSEWIGFAEAVGAPIQHRLSGL